MEIERKFLVDTLPENLGQYPSEMIEQAYLCTDPVVRVRRQGKDFWLTYKGKGLMAREEYNLPLNETAYAHLLAKADGNIITKRRYRIPLGEAPTARAADKPAGKGGDASTHADESARKRESGLTAELDVFEGKFAGLVIVETEFPDEETANAFTPPAWFGEEVTWTNAYHNSVLSQRRFPS